MTFLTDSVKTSYGISLEAFFSGIADKKPQMTYIIWQLFTAFLEKWILCKSTYIIRETKLVWLVPKAADN
jgi:hypothetical protein